ncbi:MAG: hypothetical protein LBN26_02005 [Christensenellaceae bacterium]|jgi:predicted GNAT family N-acyltransferase|nr:hypothetical protein [Christensenellaceae bacterium]
MFQSKWEIGYAAKEALALRREVFVQEQGVAEDEEFSPIDAFAAHVYVWDEKGPIAAGRMYPGGGATLRIGRIAVAPAHRAEPFDELVLRILLDKAGQTPYTTIAATLSPEESPLYARFGFARQGKPPAQYIRGQMRATYAVPRDAIIWDSPCKHM